MPFNNGEEVAPMCVKDYDIEIWRGDKWENLLSVRGNYMRFRVHKFGAVKSQKLKIVLRSTNGDGSMARLYEVRVYMD